LGFLQTNTEKKEQHCRPLVSGFKPEESVITGATEAEDICLTWDPSIDLDGLFDRTCNLSHKAAGGRGPKHIESGLDKLHVRSPPRLRVRYSDF
jgi:hypothetical protein